MKVSFLTTTAYPVISPYEGVVAVEDRLRTNPFLVVKENDTFCGVMTAADITRTSHRLVADCLVKKPVILADQDVESVLEIMRTTGYSVLPVFTETEFIGVCVHEDITAWLTDHRRQLEQEIKKHTASLLAANKELKKEIRQRKKAEKERLLLATAIEQAQEAIIITNTVGIIEYLNPAFEHISGYRAKEALGKHIRMLKSDCHDQEFYRNLWEALSSGKVWTGRFINKKKDGALYDDETAISPVRDSSGSITHYVAVKRDITLQVKTEKHLRHTQKMESIGTLAGGIAHDFNNILGGIIGYTELAKAEVAGREPAAGYLEQVLHAGGRARELVRQILSFSYKGPEQKSPLNVSLVVRESCKFIRSVLPATIDMKTDIDPDGYIVGDAVQIQQLLMNLCINAAQAMNGISGTVSVRLYEDYIDGDRVLQELTPGRYIVLGISDTGCGIEPELIDTIFDPFFTTKPRGEGTGMGLALVYSIAKNHKGAVHVASTRCEGSTFTVYFPAVYRHAAEQEAIVEELPAGTEAVLFVDDEEMLGDLGPKMLESLGYRVTAKKSSSEALEEFKKNPRGFDLVITDQTMPGKTGFEIAQEMLLIRPDLPIILCTGFSRSVPEETAKARGIRQYLLKPYGRKQLAETVRRALDGA